MTRQEFLNDVNDWSDLRDVMRDYDYYDDDEDFYSGDDYSDAIYEDINNMDGMSWEDLRDCLDNLPAEDYYATYIRSGWLDFRVATDDEFPRYKQYVLDYMDECENWDEPEEEAEYAEEETVEEAVIENDELEVDEDFDLAGFSAACVQVSAAIRTAPIEDELPLIF